jgi:hypothetical protein
MILTTVISEPVGKRTMDKVDNQSFDVAAIRVLIRHYHQMAVAKALDI